MSNWKVAKYQVEVFPHPNADKLQIVRAGEFQLVSGKGNYKTGDVVIVAPDKSVLGNGDMIREYEKYLSGSKKNRVKQAQLRGEISQGITWPTTQEVLEATFGERIADLILAAPLDEDISELMDIVKYEPPIPSALAGQVKGIEVKGKEVHLHRHDCVHLGAFAKEFDPEEQVIVTEKVHGSQFNYAVNFTKDGITEIVTSKGLLGKGLQILEDAGNAYWQAVRNDGLREKVVQLASTFITTPDDDLNFTIHVIGEVVPVQVGYSYGFTKSTALIYEVVVNGEHLHFYHTDGFGGKTLDEYFNWVPIVYIGKFKDADLYELCKGKEAVSGKELHIREGIVVVPQEMRKVKGGTWLKVKVINPKYAAKETGEEIN